jgi:feruloyl esterase
MQRVSRAVGDIIDTNDADLHAVKKRGGKVIWVHGTQDIAIPVFDSLDYYRRVAASHGGTPDYDALQPWFRLYLEPGLGHCFFGYGGVTTGFQAVDPFLALVNWVEKDVAPDSILGESFVGHTRPLCPYPKTAIYNGSGSSEDASSYHCGGNLETKEAVCWQQRAKYKHETSKALEPPGQHYRSTCKEDARGGFGGEDRHGDDEDDDD